MRTVIRFSLASVLLLAPVGVCGLQAVEGHIAIAGPTTITAPGHYILTRDFSFASGNGIVIQANNVTLDLNGHTITGPSCTGPETLVHVDTGSATQGIVIENGRLVSGCFGIQSGATNRVHIRIERVEVAGTADAAIVIRAAEFVEVLDCHTHDVTGAANGITIYGGTGAFRGSISENIVKRVGGNGIVLDGMITGEVRRNVVVDYGALGGVTNGIILYADSAAWGAGGNLVEGNTVTAAPSGTDDDGIRADATSPNNLIVDNAVTGCRIGILSNGDGARIERNVVSHNSIHGIQIAGSFAHSEENMVQANTGASGCGLKFLNGNGHVFRNNNLRNNTTGVCGGTTGTNLDGGGNIL